MKILQINTVYGEGSTGKIAQSLHDLCEEKGITCLAAHRCYRQGQAALKDAIEISTYWDSRFHGVLARFTMFKGCFSYFKTKAFLKKVDVYAPNLIHLHNLHGSYVNLPLLFRYIKKKQIPVVWTLHDCWPITAICSHFTIAQCNKWQDGCHHCPQRRKCSSCPVDFTKNVWNLKKKWFTGMENVTLVTPSHWLEGVIKASFLKDYQIKTIHNGIDLSVFTPTASDFRQKHGLIDKKIVLGVAFGWGYGKGLDVFAELSKRLPEDHAIVLVGTDDAVDATLPDNIISIHRTHDRRELAEIYTAADVFVNPTREEVLGLVNLEALACGTPVITFRAGGSPECIDDTCGAVVAVNDLDGLERELLRIINQRPYTEEACIHRAKLFDQEQKLREYTELYQSMATDTQ